MADEWSELTRLTGNRNFTVTRVKLKDQDISIEGSFELPPLARLTFDDQVFIAMFVKVHGSIKEMEQAFGVSYPTIKSRLNRIGELLGFIEAKPVEPETSVLDGLESGDISVEEALKRLRK